MGFWRISIESPAVIAFVDGLLFVKKKVVFVYIKHLIAVLKGFDNENQEI